MTIFARKEKRKDKKTTTLRENPLFFKQKEDKTVQF